MFLPLPAPTTFFLLLTSSFVQTTLSAPVDTTPSAAAAAAAAATAKIRGVRDPIYHLYLQALPSNASHPVLGPESSADEFTIDSTIRSESSGMYLNIQEAGTSYKPLVWGGEEEGATKAWGLEGDTIITMQGSEFGRQLNFLACAAEGSGGYYDLFLQTGSETPSGRSCSNYQTIHLPCLC